MYIYIDTHVYMFQCHVNVYNEDVYITYTHTHVHYIHTHIYTYIYIYMCLNYICGSQHAYHSYCGAVNMARSRQASAAKASMVCLRSTKATIGFRV